MAATVYLKRSLPTSKFAVVDLSHTTASVNLAALVPECHNNACLIINYGDEEEQRWSDNLKIVNPEDVDILQVNYISDGQRVQALLEYVVATGEKDLS